MQRVKLDRAGPAVKKFLRSLPIDQGDVELELDGKIVCKVSGPNKLSDAEKASLRAKGRELLTRSREGNKDVPTQVIRREVEAAVRAIRGRK